MQDTNKQALCQKIDAVCQEIVMKQLMSGDRTFLYTSYTPTFTKPKYQFSRTKWYEANLPWQQSKEVIAWCTAQFGQRPAERDAWTRWYHSMSILHFRDHDDYMLFVLTWGK